MKIDKDYAKVINPYIKSGQATLVQGGKHPALVFASGHKVPFPSTAGDWRSIKNLEKHLRHVAAI